MNDLHFISPDYALSIPDIPNFSSGFVVRHIYYLPQDQKQTNSISKSY